MWDLVKQILSPAVVSVVVVAMISAVRSIRQDKLKSRRIEERDATEELGEFRAAAEAHILGFDVPVQEGMMQLRAVINQMRLEQGKEPIAFPPLPSPIPLFPKRNKS